ncbi:unnamed protein product [Malus baccata var. baccata]
MKGFNVSFNHLSSVIPGNLRQFPDSAFYPGNSLLIFPLSPSSPEGVPNMTFSVHRPLMKAAIRISLIVVVKNPKNLGHPESKEKGEGTSSPMSLLSSSNPSPSKTQQPLESSAVLTAYSPDILTGDLHLFYGSLAFTAELSCAPA